MKPAVLLLTFSLSLSWLRAQEGRPISVSFQKAAFDVFVKEVESQSDYRFYFDPAQTDSLTVTLTLDRAPLDSALNLLFRDSDYSYVIDRSRAVFITRGRALSPYLAPGFFAGEDAARSGFDYSEFQRKELTRKEQAHEYRIGKRGADMSGQAVIEGSVKDKATGEAMIGAAVFIENPMTGTVTDPFGNFRLALPKGRHELIVKSVSMKTLRLPVILYSAGRLDIEMELEVRALKEVVIEAERDARVATVQMGLERLEMKTLKQMPTVLGEADPIRIMLTLPGVQTAGEASSGINVRGGATSQNLILFNDATVYNPSHLFGFFSAFNADVLKEVELYKSGIAADYGGRLSSVMEVTSREGNKKKFTTTGGISPVTGRLTFEGPLVKDKTSFLVGARSTYSDWLLQQIDYKEIQDGEAGFYDVHAHVSHSDGRNQINASAYVSRDKFRLNNDTLYEYGDRNINVKWQRKFGERMFGVLSAGGSRYAYSLSSDGNPVNAFDLGFTIDQLNARAGLTFQAYEKHTLQGGISVIRYALDPGRLQPTGSESIIEPDDLEDEQAWESAVHIGDNFELNERWSLYGGLRYSFFRNVGPKSVYQYAEGFARDALTITDTTAVGGGETVASYSGPEARFSARYLLPYNASLKFSYTQMRQYLQMLSNTTTIAPTDIWKLSDNYIQPQVGHQYAVGYYKSLSGGRMEVSAEAYYKTSRNTIDFKDGATLLLNHHIETEVVNTRGRAYGVELLLRKPAGKLNGWASYAYSRSLLQTTGSYESETVNNGDFYPSNYDKPHAFNWVSNYRFNRRISFSLNATYSTGRPITLPLGVYSFGNGARLYYSERNQYRIPDYFRIDASVSLEGNHKIHKPAHGSWSLSVYNLTGRDNVYSIFFSTEGEKISGYQLSVFAQPVPTLTYNFRF